LAKQRFVQTRPFAVLGMILLIWLFLPPIIKSWLNYSFYEMQAPSMLSASYLRDIQDYWTLRTRKKTELIEGIRDLARLNAAYESRLHENEMLRREIARLEEILNLPSLPGYRYEVARVARRDINGWWQQMIIRKGASDGIEEGAPVIFSGGVVGRVRKVYPNSSVVDLLSSQQIRLAAMLEGDDRPISFRGGINPSLRAPRGIAELVPPDITANERQPRKVLTSGLGGVFPAGIYIGEIQVLELAPDGMFQSGQVILHPRLNELKEVAVILPIQGERP